VIGAPSRADIYPSNGLSRKMWPKLLRASITEKGGDQRSQRRQRASATGRGGQ
jgi:hypothetical protein